jgi:hypothetical protein
LVIPHFVQSLRVILQQGVQPSWFEFAAASTGEGNIQRTLSRGGDLRHHLLTPQNPIMGETVFAEVLLKALGPYRRTGEAVELRYVHGFFIEVGNWKLVAGQDVAHNLYC